MVLRRFMSLKRFRQIIESSSLYFPPASKFEDDFEGNPTNRDHVQRESQLKSYGIGEPELAMAKKANQMTANWNRRAIVISCWTRNSVNHTRMWDEYAGGDCAVAIETTVGRLQNCLGDGFLIIPVKYIDFDRDQIPRGHSLLPFFYKRAELFEWENEVRIIGEMEIGSRIESPRLVRVDLDALIQKITVAPTAPEDFTGVVRSLAQHSLPGVPIEEPKKNRLATT